MAAITPNDSTIEIEDINNNEDEEERNVEAEQDTVTPDFVKQNYAMLKHLLEEHEKTEKLKEAAEDIMEVARRVQSGEGGLFFTPHNKTRVVPGHTATTSTRSAGNEGETTHKE